MTLKRYSLNEDIQVDIRKSLNYLNQKRKGEIKMKNEQLQAMEYPQENAQTLKAVIMAGLVEADGEKITERTVAEAILSEVKTGKEVLHATEFKLVEDDELGIYRVAHPVINLEGYWVEFDAKEEYAEVRYNYNNRIEGTTVEELEDFDFECAYNYGKVSRITTPTYFFEVDDEENLI